MSRKADPNRKTDILRAAGQVFAQKGYASTRMIEVAEAASVGKGTIYEYFKSKEALFFAVFETMMAESTESIVQTEDSMDGPFSLRIKKLIDGLIQSWLEQLDIYGLVLEFWSATASSSSRDSFRAAFQAGYSALRTNIANMIRDAQQTGEVAPDIDAMKIAAALVGTLDALLLQAWLDPQFDAPATSDAFLDVVLRGLKKP